MMLAKGELPQREELRSSEQVIASPTNLNGEKLHADRNGAQRSWIADRDNVWRCS